MARSSWGMAAYRYGLNTPTSFVDRDGRYAESPFDVARFVVSAAAFLEEQNWTTFAAVVVDGAALLTPGAPALGGVLIRGASKADEAATMVNAVGKVAGAGATATKAAPPAGAAPEEARFIGEPNGTLVDTHAAPRGSYDQPGGGRTDVLQREDHGAGHSHTHDPKTNTNPKTGQTFTNGLEQPGRSVSAEDVENIINGVATPTAPKAR